MNKYKFRLYKHRFNDNWHVEVVESDRWHLYCAPNRKFWTKCLKVFELGECDAIRYFGRYFEEGGFTISAELKKKILKEIER